MIVIGGDAIVDLIDRGQRLFEASPGGSTLNCALTSGHLGSDVLYVSTLSRDVYGDLLVARLQECHVILRADARSDACSSLAVICLDEANQPSYAFYREGTADREIPVDAVIASFPTQMSIFHVGSCALIPSDDQDAWLQVVLAAQEHGALISIDPNCRPSMTRDPDRYRKGIARFLQVADLIKLSDEDLEYLHPEWTDQALSRFIETYSPQLCVYTRGSEGLTGFTGKGVTVSVEASLPGPLSDTVGAGDSVQGTLLSEIDRLGLSDHALFELGAESLREILTFAARVAGVNCTRAGCQPPTREEVKTIFGSCSAASSKALIS
ncbi:MAG: carbohydrate kinase [Litorivicinaceae bacterium]|nr:carbohydrate kinase [Litorivicinaceae bacterium]